MNENGIVITPIDDIATEIVNSIPKNDTPSVPSPAPTAEVKAAEENTPTTVIPTPAETEKQAEPQKPESDAWIKISEQQQKLAKAQAEIEAKSKELDAKLDRVNKYEEAKKRSKENPLALLEENNLTFDELTQFVLNNKNQPPELKVKALEELVTGLGKKLEDSIGQLRAEEAQRKQANTDEALKHYKQELKKAISAKPDDYELIIASNAFDTVYEVQKVYWEQNGTDLPVEEAAEQVERFFYQQGEKLLKAKKFAPKPKVEEASDPVKPSTTLSDSAMSAPIVSPSDSKRLTLDDSKKNAAKLIRWD